MRAFIGIPLSEDGARLVDDLQKCLREIPPFSEFRWIPSPNVHLTLRFLGEISERQMASAASALETACADRSIFPLSFDRLGVFPRPRNPGVLWVGSRQPPEGLMALAASLTQELALVGFDPEDRNFRPHFTLARRRRNAPLLGGVREALQEAEKRCFCSPAIWSPQKTVLFRSELKPNGAVYHAEHTVPFGG